MLLAYPGKSNLWLSLVDQLFSFDDIFGSSNSLLDAQLLEQIVAEAVVAKRVKESIPLPHPMRNPFGAEDAEMAVSVVVQKASFALASFALLTLFV
jgi:hypothetical protein